MILWRGVDDPISKIQHIIPTEKIRKSRDNWNIWNLMFDRVAGHQSIPLRSFALIASSDQQMADEYGEPHVVLPVGDPRIAFCPNDFTVIYDVTRFEGITGCLLRVAVPKQSIQNVLFSVLKTGTSIPRTLKALEVLCRYVARQRPDDIIYRLKLQCDLENVALNDIVIKHIKHGRLFDFYTNMMSPARGDVSVCRLSELTYDM